MLAATHQTWLRDPATGHYLLDVFREPHDGQTWICRHDETIRLFYSEIIHHTPDAIPYLAPELVLLLKAKQARPTPDLLGQGELCFGTDLHTGPHARFRFDLASRHTHKKAPS